MTTGPTTSTDALGARFVDALVAHDRGRLSAVLHPEVDFRGLTPNRSWEAHDAAGAVEIMLGPFVVEQQAYLSERDERIGWMRVVCSGFRSPIAP